jgi:hypothetical protein
MRKLLDNQDTGRALFLKLDGYVDDVWVYSTKDPMTISVDICLPSSHEEEYLDRAIKEIVKRVTEKNPDLELVGSGKFEPDFILFTGTIQFKEKEITSK